MQLAAGLCPLPIGDPEGHCGAPKTNPLTPLPHGTVPWGCGAPENA